MVFAKTKSLITCRASDCRVEFDPFGGGSKDTRTLNVTAPCLGTRHFERSPLALEDASTANGAASGLMKNIGKLTGLSLLLIFWDSSSFAQTTSELVDFLSHTVFDLQKSLADTKAAPEFQK